MLVDATKGIQAQTLSNFYKAFDAVRDESKLKAEYRT